MSGDGHQGRDGLEIASHQAATDLTRRSGCLRSPRRRLGLRRFCLTATAFVTSIVFLGLIGAGLFFARLSQGPIALDIKPQIMAALNERVGHGYQFDLASTSIEATDHGPALTMNALSVSDGAGHPVITAPKAAISVDTMGLMVGRIAPTRLEIHDLDVNLVILPDGQVAVSAGNVKGAAFPLTRAFSDASHTVHGAAAPDAARPASGEPPATAAVKALAAVLRSLVDATTARDSALGSLDRVSVTGRLVLDDRTHGTTTVFRNTVLSYDKMPDGSAVLQVAADGPAGRWSILARTFQSPDQTKTLTVTVRDISLDEITLAGGLRDLGFDFDMPVSANFGFHLSKEGALDKAGGTFELGSGYFKLDDPDHEPLMVDSVAGGFHFDPASRGIVIERTTLHAGESSFVMTGHVDPPPAPLDPWSFTAEASGTFGAERPGEKPIQIERAGLSARIMPADRRLEITSVNVSGPEIDYSGKVAVQGDAAGGFVMDGTHVVHHMPAQALVRLWPSMIAAPVRAWFLQNCHGGWVESGKAVVHLTDADVRTMRAEHSVPDDHVRVDYDVSALDLGFMPGVPPLSNLSGTGSVTGHTAHFKARGGTMEVSPGRKLLLAGGDFNVADSDPKPTPATILAHATGAIDTVADLLSRPALKPFANVPIDGSAVKGQVDANLSIAMRIGANVPPEDTKIDVEATATNFEADRLIGKESLVDSTISLKADRNGITAKGEGRMYGAPATLELKKPPGGAASEAVINVSLDDAARIKAGFTLGKGLAGIVTARISTSLGGSEKAKSAAVELDFAKATIDGLIPGFTKPQGRAGKATLNVLQHDGGMTLDAINFEGGGASLRGTAELDASGAFLSAKLSQLRLSPGDDMRVDAAQGAEGLKLVLRGGAMDARPFLKWLGTTGPGGTSETAEAAKSLEIDLHANTLGGLNGQSVSGADLRLSRRGGQIRRFQLTGKFGPRRLVVSTVDRGGEPLFVVKSDDAGASLAFLDLYRKLLGGRLDANLTLLNGRIQGFAAIHDFSLREDPAMRKLAAESLVSQNRSSNDPRVMGSDSAMTFTKLQGHFTRTGSLVEIHDAAFFGPQAGATLEGTLDFVQDKINLSGTYVPIYGVNNLFSQIPLFGPILGGGAHEGLFAVNFRITGSPSAPIMNVNPLSALAPGFLRKIFGAIDSAAEGQPPPRDRASGPASEPLELSDPAPEQE